jgi:hypothetical protein
MRLSILVTSKNCSSIRRMPLLRPTIRAHCVRQRVRTEDLAAADRPTLRIRGATASAAPPSGQRPGSFSSACSERQLYGVPITLAPPEPVRHNREIIPRLGLFERCVPAAQLHRCCAMSREGARRPRGKALLPRCSASSRPLPSARIGGWFAQASI